MCSPTSEVLISVTFVSPSTDTTLGVPFVPNVASWSSSWSVTFTKDKRFSREFVRTVVVSSPLTEATTGFSFVTGVDTLPALLLYVPSLL